VNVHADILFLTHKGAPFARLVVRTFSTYRKSGRLFILRVMAFHEKAGRSQGNSGFIASFLFFVAEKKFSSPSSRCRHASIRTLEERIVSLGACGAFSIQPVLPSVWRPIVALKSGTWPRPLTQSPELGFGFCLFSSLERFGFCFRFFKRLP
jgi:hypothetical protein